jgi:hypothetical protein
MDNAYNVDNRSAVHGPKETEMSNIHEYGNFRIDLDALPPKSVSALVARGISHYLGNEMSAKVASHFRSQAVKALGEGATKEAKEAAAKAVKLDPESEEYQAVKLGFQNDGIKALNDGTIGEGASRGPRVDPVTAERNAIVTREVLAILRANKLWTEKKNPSDSDTLDLGGTTHSVADLKARHLAKHEARIGKEADAKIKADARKRAQAEEAAAKRGEAPVTLEALGF